MKRRVTALTWLLMLSMVLSAPTYAQDKNTLARIAYENAETAFASGDIQEANTELQKVDKLLGKVTPKSQYLRVQLGVAAAERDGDRIDAALKECKSYLNLSKQYDLPEEKVMDVTRLKMKWEKEKVTYAKRREAELACTYYVKKLEQAIPTRDESKIKLLSPLDFDLELFDALKKTGKYSASDRSWIRRKSTESRLNLYEHKTDRYKLDVSMSYLGGTGAGSYQVKGLDLPLTGWYAMQTSSGELHKVRLQIDSDKWTSFVEQVSALLGFEADKHGSNDKETYAYWLFKNYTVSVEYFEWRETHPWMLTMTIVKHLPSKATKVGPSPHTGCEGK